MRSHYLLLHKWEYFINEDSHDIQYNTWQNAYKYNSGLKKTTGILIIYVSTYSKLCSLVSMKSINVTRYFMFYRLYK